ncbi:MAG: hypothetical protein EOO29_40635, partial [Comamonadaceae bacterium]
MNGSSAQAAPLNRPTAFLTASAASPRQDPASQHGGAAPQPRGLASRLHPVSPLPRIMLEPLVRAALLEDLGRAGDLTSDLIVPADTRTSVRLSAREAGVLAGLDAACLAFELLNP